MSCDGRCCAVFTLPADVTERLDAGANAPDSEFIIDMLVPLGAAEAKQRARGLGYELPESWFGRNGHVRTETKLFTCRHWDEATALCGVYEERPQMCRKYPYGRSCEHCDCTEGEPYGTSA